MTTYAKLAGEIYERVFIRCEDMRGADAEFLNEIRIGKLVCVPAEPTEAMLRAVRQAPHPTRLDGWDGQHAKIYRVMLKAAGESP